MKYEPARWIPGPDAMTVFGPLFRPPPAVPLERERWELHDGDFVDVDRLHGPREAPLLLALHGLEGNTSAHYLRGLLFRAKERGWRALALNFRTCSGSVNRLLRSYHSGETGDFGELVVRALRESDRVVVAGCSLGGNVLVKWLGEKGEAVPSQIKAAAALSVPFDLAACSRTLDGPGFWRRIYRTRFLRTLKKKALEKLRTFPGAYDGERVRRARTLFEFDDAVTATVHGFAGAEDYYARSSSGPYVARVRTPLLLLSALDDPFIPASTLPSKVPPSVTLEVWPFGGHLGFVEGPLWAPRFYAERRAIEFLASHL
ncbi:MAG TPA: alpha/beta fold hydrolase [Myxococcales bacterium]